MIFKAIFQHFNNCMKSATVFLSIPCYLDVPSICASLFKDLNNGIACHVSSQHASKIHLRARLIDLHSFLLSQEFFLELHTILAALHHSLSYGPICYSSFAIMLSWTQMRWTFSLIVYYLSFSITMGTIHYQPLPNESGVRVIMRSFLVYWNLYANYKVGVAHSFHFRNCISSIHLLYSKGLRMQLSIPTTTTSTLCSVKVSPFLPFLLYA